MDILQGIGLQFRESMSGYIEVSESHPGQKAFIGSKNRAAMRIDVCIRIDDLSLFLKDPDHRAELSGTVTCEQLGEQLPIQDGYFNLFLRDPKTGMLKMVYLFKFTAGGWTYFFDGHKDIHDNPCKIDLVKDMTQLFTRVYHGNNNQAPLYGEGELNFKLWDAPSLVASMKVLGHPSWWQQVVARMAFFSFAFGALLNEYLLKYFRPFYNTKYKKLVLSGLIDSEEGKRPFFLASGIFDKAFPWGNDEKFSDVILAVGDDKGGYEGYCITGTIPEGVVLDIDKGKCRYKGPIFAPNDGYTATFTEIRQGAARLVKCEADFEIDFQVKKKYNTVHFPFPLLGRRLHKLFAPLAKTIRRLLPSIHPLDIQITPHTVIVHSDSKLIITKPDENPKEMLIDYNHTFGEIERSTLSNIREPEPALLYRYICAVQHASQVARVQIYTSTMLKERNWVKNPLNKFLGNFLLRFAAGEMLMKDGRLRERRFTRQGEGGERPNLFKKLGDPVIEVSNDHFKTAWFQRRIVKVQDPCGLNFLALEEDVMLFTPENCRASYEEKLKEKNLETEIKVASIRNEQSKFQALDDVLTKTDFLGTLEKIRRGAKEVKARYDFSIVIKPNFMFAYDKRDPTTFTDPELVGHLVKWLKARSFQTISVVEAQSTLGEYFDKRGVAEMAEYLGFDSAAGYEIVDITEDAKSSFSGYIAYLMQDLGLNLDYHPVSPVWEKADFRISFAKNKTHSYSYYTLTLKNVFGALPMANKLKEYHCSGRDIYNTTIEYLDIEYPDQDRFPVHFGLVDAYLSADGPFGVLADQQPNNTHTIIGGANLVAVDWVAATKMGIDPMISKFMKLAVDKFGKPKINLVGDGSLYNPWLNVPVIVSLFSNNCLSGHYHFSNCFYKLFAQMDEEHFKHKSGAPVRLLRWLIAPLRGMIYITGKKPSRISRTLNWVIYKIWYL